MGGKKNGTEERDKMGGRKKREKRNGRHDRGMNGSKGSPFVAKNIENSNMINGVNVQTSGIAFLAKLHLWCKKNAKYCNLHQTLTFFGSSAKFGVINWTMRYSTRPRFNLIYIHCGRKSTPY